MIGQQFCLNVTGLNWMGRRMDSEMMVFSKASILDAYGTRMIVLSWPLRLEKFSICQTPSGEKIGKLSRLLTIGIFTM